MNKYTIRDFQLEFTDDGTCLEWLKNYLYPRGIHCKQCQRITKHHRVAKRPSYSCDHCGHHVHPTAGTIFEKSSTPLKLWFYAIYLMSSTRCGISAKHLQRVTGVTYKTAWRMFTQIRKLLNEADEPLSGNVEIDETYIGGKRSGKRGRGAAGKTAVLGMVERGGRVVAVKAENVKAATLMPVIKEHVLSKSNVYTDELASYNNLRAEGYLHRRIHHASKIYVAGNVHTNTIEGFWSLIKRSLNGAHHAISEKHLQSYLDEYAFRYNHRNDEQPMFKTILEQISAC